MQLQESGEMYLETIWILSERQKPFRSIDVCEEMGYSKPSVSRAVGLLKNGGFITVDGGGFISLTAIGEETAKKIYERHTLLTSFLMGLGVSEETAASDACRMEHIISDETLNAIKHHMNESPASER